MVRKYTKTRKQYKSKSNSKSIPRKTKKNKFSKNKSRKIRGGTHENNDYVFAGVSTNSLLWDRERKLLNINDIPGIPIFLPNDNTLKNTLPGRITFWIGNEGSSVILHLLLPVLYKLNYRGLNFESLSRKYVNGRPILFYDNNEIPILDYKNSRDTKLLINQKDEIKNMELKYPGLFQRMYVTEEEEHQALEALERKVNTDTRTPEIQTNINHSSDDVNQQNLSQNPWSQNFFTKYLA